MPLRSKLLKPQFGLKTIFALMLLGAIFSVYANSQGWFWNRRPVAGTWELQVNRHFRKANLIANDDGDFVFTGSTVFAGVYERSGNRLTIKAPVDKRMIGLIWEWKSDEWHLVSEPLPPPTGSTYAGARLFRAETKSDRTGNGQN